MNLNCTDPAKLDAIILGGAILLLFLNGFFCVSVVQSRGWLALPPLCFPHIYTLLGSFLLLSVFAWAFPNAFAHVPDRPLELGLYLILFALAVRWGKQRFGSSQEILAMQLVMFGLTLVILVTGIYTPDSSEVIWPYCD